MSTCVSDKPVPAKDKNRQLAITGLTISTIGLIGWMALLFVVFSQLSVPAKEESADVVQNMINVFGTFLDAMGLLMIGLIGLSINGTLSITGTLISASALSLSDTREAKIGLALGIAGILVGIAIVVLPRCIWG